MKGWLVWGTLVTAALAVGGYFYFHPLPGLAARDAVGQRATVHRDGRAVAYYALGVGL